MISFSTIGVAPAHTTSLQEHEAADASAAEAPVAPLHEEVTNKTASSRQRESLMTSILTNIANMKHEALKGIANNLRG